MTTIKNRITRGVLALAAMCFVLAAAPMMARAESWDEIRGKDANKDRAGGRVNASSSTCLTLYYVGTATANVYDISATSITSEAPFNTSDSTNFGSAGSRYNLDAAAYDTMGELCDTIDALANYECVLQGCIRSDNTTLLRDQASADGTNDARAAGGFDVAFDTGPINDGGTPASTVYNIRVGIQPNDGKRVTLRTCTGNANVAGDVRVFGRLRKFEGSGLERGVASTAIAETRNDTTEVWRVATVDDTDLQIPVDIDDNGWLEFGRNEHVVISIGNGTGIQAAANFLECAWIEK